MKSIVMSFVLCVFGMCMVIAIGSVFEYTTAYKNLSFDVRHALMESGKIAITPIINYEFVPCDENELEEDYCDVDGEKIEIFIEYMDKYEFFDELMKVFKNTKKSNQDVLVELMYYTNNPFLAKVKVTTLLEGIFIKKEIVIEEVLIET